jgi:hypothetical protein
MIGLIHVPLEMWAIDLIPRSADLLLVARIPLNDFLRKKFSLSLEKKLNPTELFFSPQIMKQTMKKKVCS